MSLDLGRAEPHHGGTWWGRHPSAGPPLPSPQRALPGNPQRREAASHLRDPEEHFCHLSLGLGSKPQWPGWEVGLWKAGMGNGGLRISKASEFCPPSVREHEHKKQLCAKKEN